MVNTYGRSLTELDARTGDLVRVISGERYGLLSPTSIATNGRDVWVVDCGSSDAVTELSAASGRLVRLLTATRFGFERPDAVVADATHAWVANSASDTVTELDASGALDRIIESPGTGLHAPDAMALRGGDLFVANGSNTVSELVAATGTAVRLLHGHQLALNEPDALAVDGTVLAVASAKGDAVTLLNARTGGLERVVRVLAIDSTIPWASWPMGPRCGRSTRSAARPPASRRHRDGSCACSPAEPAQRSSAEGSRRPTQSRSQNSCA